jgi:DNA polymerase-3 subunit delta'
MKPCGSCHGCTLLATGNHPDLKWIGADSDDEDEEAQAEKSRKQGAKMIRIDQIRELDEFVFVGSHRLGRRVVVISDAETMNPAAANALLKTLEEPPASVYFILISGNDRLLLPTIRSRCRVLRLTKPAADTAAGLAADLGLAKDAARWLALAGGAPFRALQWQEEGILDALEQVIDSLRRPGSDPLALAARWDGLIRSQPRISPGDVLEELLRWVHDLSRQAQGLPARYHVHPDDRINGVTLPTQACLSDAWNDLIQFRRVSRHPLNQLLFLESVATRYLRALRPSTP